jgi:hypothetical protein
METLKIHTKDKEQLKTVKAILKALKGSFWGFQESPYDPEFVDKIKESERQAKRGMVKAIKTEDLWK